MSNRINARFTHNVEQSLARLRDNISDAMDIDSEAVCRIINTISSLVTAMRPMDVLRMMPSDEFRKAFLSIVGDAAIIGIAKAVEEIEV